MMHGIDAFWRYAEAKNVHDLDAAMIEWIDEAVVDVVPFGLVVAGKDLVRLLFDGLLVALPNYAGVIETVVANDEAGVAAQWRMRGTNDGPFLSLPATGRDIDVRVVSMFGTDGRCLASETIYFDLATLARQMGLPLEEIRTALAPLSQLAATS